MVKRAVGVQHVFVPFTGIDNHKRSVTFGAGLLCNETTDSYTWLLQCFMRAFGKEPNLVVTDQDAAIKKAVITVFNTARHRLCMWHIGKKLDDKVSTKIMATDFKKRIHKIIWHDRIDGDEFDREVACFDD